MLAAGVLVAISVQLSRVFVIVILLSEGFSKQLVVPVLAMGIVTVGVAIVYYSFLKKASKKQARVKAAVANSPFEIAPALKFGVLFTVTLFTVYFAKKYFGDGGVYFATVIASVVDVDAIIFSALLSFESNKMDLALAGNIIAITIIVNNVAKMFYVFFFGSRKFFKILILPLMLIVFTGIVASIIIM